jgi:GNAT superfamily N-acetyltransferase
LPVMLAPCRGPRGVGCGSGAAVGPTASITLSRTMSEPEPIIRLAQSADADAIADVQLRSFHTAMPSITLAHTDDEVRDWIATTVLPDPGLETWVAEAADGSVVGMMVLGADMIEQLYLLPDVQGQGLGDRFIELARTRRPDGLSLYAFQINARARRFYERHGFEAVWFGDGSSNEEGEPDVRYAWAPQV